MEKKDLKERVSERAVKQLDREKRKLKGYIRSNVPKNKDKKKRNKYFDRAWEPNIEDV